MGFQEASGWASACGDWVADWVESVYDLCVVRHLKFKEVALWKVIAVSWAIAFFEYCLQVPANRMARSVFGRPVEGDPGGDHAERVGVFSGITSATGCTGTTRWH